MACPRGVANGKAGAEAVPRVVSSSVPIDCGVLKVRKRKVEAMDSDNWWSGATVEHVGFELYR